ncbi:MAG TPA: S8 family serine peptidase [Methanospirillum sp.]|nr:S8 family serine peptidase [Methanospirillum sp.]
MLNQRWIRGIILLIVFTSAAGLTLAAGTEQIVSAPDNSTVTVPAQSDSPVTAEPTAPYVPGQVIVRYKSQTSDFIAASVATEQLTSLDAQVVDDFSAEGLKGMQKIEVGDEISVQEAIAELNNSQYVAYAEPNYIISLSLPSNPEPPGPEQVGALAASGAPNDPRFSEQWNLENTGQGSGTSGADISALDAWARTTGSSQVIVAIIDTGVDYNHPDLAQNIWTNPGEVPGNGIDDDGNGYVDDVHGWDFINNDNDPMDDNGHGTHCAGVVGAVGNNGVGISGVNWNVKIMPLKFLRADGNGDTAASLNAIAYARRMGADVISCSWGGTARSQSLQDAIAATDKLVVCAAGNSGTNNDVIQHYPSGFDNAQIISVAASDASDGMPSYSNYGPLTVDVAAPGDWILSTYPSSLGYQYIKMKGTSMATPHVSGLAAMLLAVNSGLSTAQQKQMIMDYADRVPAFSGKIVSGGRINAGKSVVAAGGGPTPTPTPTSGPVVKTLPGMSSPPRDLNGDGKYEDVNGNGRVDFADVTVYFQNMEWIIANEPVSAFDYSGNGRIDYTDIVTLFNSIA